MSDDKQPKTPIWQMIKTVMEHADGEMSYPAIKQRLREQYPDQVLNTATVNCQLISCSVNLPSRIYYSDNKQPVLADRPSDFLYSVGRGKVVWYNPEKHGLWEIALADDGSLVVRSVGDGTGEEAGIPQASTPSDEANGAFALEAHLRDYLAKNLPTLPGHGAPLKLFVPEGRSGIEFQTDVGPIDVLAVGGPTGDDFYVLELKLQRGVDAALGQILRYMGWVKEHLANGKSVFGVIIASDVSIKLKYAATQVPNVILMEYRLSVDLKPVALRS